MSDPRARKGGPEGPVYWFKRAGLAVYRMVTVRADDASPEAIRALDQLLDDASPKGRLRRVKLRAESYREDLRLADEIELIESRLRESYGRADETVLFALTAVERGLDLLDTGLHLRAVQGHARSQEKRRLGGINSATARQKLPKGQRLLALIDEIGVAAVAERYGVQPAAVRKARRKAQANGTK